MGGATRFFILISTPLPLPLLHHRCPSLLRLVRYHHKLLPTSLSSSLAPFPSTPYHLHRYRTASASSFPPVRASEKLHTQSSSYSDDCNSFTDSSPNSSQPGDSNLWPEWSKLLENLYAAGYFDRHGIGGIGYGDELMDGRDLPDEFIRAANACLAFARERANLLGLLPRRDIEVLVESGTPFLFRNGEDSMRKIKSFLGSGETNVSFIDRAQTVDLMRFILSYASNQTFGLERNLGNTDHVESSAQNLLRELSNLTVSPTDSESFGSVNSFPDTYGQTPKILGQKIEMKRGDWICPRCSFMNFARNMKCLECEEVRPKRQLTGGEWECPQCDFFNYGRNTVCLRCDCKRPGDLSFSSSNTMSGIIRNDSGSNAMKGDIDRRLAANEEKAQRWFSKVSQLDSTSDMNNAITDEDFPEIMPLRKGVNRFVVSTRKTPLERRLANSQYQRNLGNESAFDGNGNQHGDANKLVNTTIGRSLDDILGPASAASKSSNVNTGQSTGIKSPSILGSGSNSSYVPFVPLPPDMFAQKKPENSHSEMKMAVRDNSNSWSNDSSPGEDGFQVKEKPLNQTGNIDEEEQAEKSERWFKKVAELHNVTDLSTAISDEDFPEIMPMRKGENRFVVSKKKDRSLTSPAYKRRVAMDQAGNSNFVPFVPFPPDYFAKKDQNQQPDDSMPKATDQNPISANKPLEQSDNAGSGLHNRDSVQDRYIQQNLTSENPTPTSVKSSGYARKETNQRPNISESSNPESEIQNIKERWSGKSLEGSAVKEPDPLDMSEEAKAERWFRRVAQIKDISELSQIPDEDFPSIMPMRKGVNRFVVSKRKTPLERRLTSPQYRRHLPIVSSDPSKKENDNS